MNTPTFRTNLACGLMLMALWAIAAFMPSQTASYILCAAASLAVMLCFLFYAAATTAQEDEWDTGWTAADGSQVKNVDPWAMQQELMRISDQPVPSLPMLSKNSIMYASLVMEEGAETFCDGMVPALDRLLLAPITRNLDPEQVRSLKIIRGKLQECGFHMANASRTIRSYLKNSPDFTFHLNRDEAKAIYDGVVDTTVVVCGLTLASGLDGPAGYLDVAGSNLSKADSRDGKIHKHPDGKWIKGDDYRAPNLDAILDRQAAGFGAA